MNRRHFFKLLPAVGAVGALGSAMPKEVVNAYKYAGRPKVMPNDHIWRIGTYPGKSVLIVNHDNPDEVIEAIRYWLDMKRWKPESVLTLEPVTRINLWNTNLKPVNECS